MYLICDNISVVFAPLFVILFTINNKFQFLKLSRKSKSLCGMYIVTFRSSCWSDPRNLNFCCFVMWLFVMTSSLFTVSIDTSHRLVPLQIASSMECAPDKSSTECVGLNGYVVASNMWAPILDPLLGAKESSGVVTSPTYAPAVPVELLSMSLDLGSFAFFCCYSPFYLRVGGLSSCWDIVLTYS